MGVEHGKVGDDNGDGQRDREDSGEGAKCPHEHSGIRFRRHVAITDGSHSYDGPPKPLRYALEAIVRVILEN